MEPSNSSAAATSTPDLCAEFRRRLFSAKVPARVSAHPDGTVVVLVCAPVFVATETLGLKTPDGKANGIWYTVRRDRHDLFRQHSNQETHHDSN